VQSSTELLRCGVPCRAVTAMRLQAVVGSIVREKELRLREGMRILGLSVRTNLAAAEHLYITFSCRCLYRTAHFPA